MLTTRMEETTRMPLAGGFDEPPHVKPPVVFAEPPEFKVGDVVYLKGAQWPLMTVEAIFTGPEGRIIKTVWFGPDATLKRETFVPELLEIKIVQKQ